MGSVTRSRNPGSEEKISEADREWYKACTPSFIHFESNFVCLFLENKMESNNFCQWKGIIALLLNLGRKFSNI
jgi:hypothetical protein